VWLVHVSGQGSALISLIRLGLPAALPATQLPAVTKTVLLYGVLAGLLIAGLKVIEYRFLVVEHSLEIYGGAVALIFATMGIWLGLRLNRPHPASASPPTAASLDGPFVANEERLQRLGITPRELEIIELIAAGMSNREIAEKLFVTENTVKTHASRVFDKLGARRRTQAVQLAKEQGLIP
jgi:DNA-binding CsgD family transcriptional regulator